MGTVKRVYMEKLDLNNFSSTKNEKNVTTMTLTWKSKNPEKPQLTTKQKIKTFSEVGVQLYYDGKMYDFQAVILRP